MRSPKVLICGILPPPNFGHSMIYKALMEGDFVKEYEVVFFNMKFWSYEQHKKVTVGKLLKFLQYYLKYIVLLIQERPKYVLYAMSFDKMPFVKDFVFCLTGMILGSRIVLHDMGQYLPELYDSSPGLLKRMIRFLMKRVWASIVLGEVTRSVYQGFMPIEHVYAVPGAVQDSKTEIPKVQKRHEPGQTVKVLYFSFLSRTKGILTALQALPVVIKSNDNIRFIFAGPFESPVLKSEIEDYVHEHHLESFVDFVGYVGEDEKRTTLFRTCDLFIFPTIRDVFGLVLLHAMAEGIPVVASIEGAIPEIVQDGKTGSLFPKGNAQALAEKILSLAQNSHIRESMGRHGREKYEQMYTLNHYSQRMIQTFKQIELQKS